MALYYSIKTIIDINPYLTEFEFKNNNICYNCNVEKIHINDCGMLEIEVLKIKCLRKEEIQIQKIKKDINFYFF